MVGADTLLPSTVTGNGPDVAIQVNYSMPTNFAYRNAAYDLTQFYDFKDVASEFSPGAMEYMEYNGGYYGLPDQMSFPVIFYRKDIFEQLNLSVPETWNSRWQQCICTNHRKFYTIRAVFKMFID